MPVSLRMACDIRRACRPICGSPMSPSISACGTNAATESTHDDIQGAAADEDVGNFQRLLAAVGLGDEQIVRVHAQLARAYVGSRACARRR